MFPQSSEKTAVAAGPNQVTEGDRIDADLARLAQEWPTLPPAIKAAVMALVDAANRTLSGTER